MAVSLKLFASQRPGKVHASNSYAETLMAVQNFPLQHQQQKTPKFIQGTVMFLERLLKVMPATRKRKNARACWRVNGAPP